MLTITGLEIIVAVATVLVCAAFMLKSKTSIAKLVVLVGITLLCVLELTRSPLQNRVARLERELVAKQKYAPHDPGIKQLEKSLEDAKSLLTAVNADPNRWPERLPFNLGLDLRGGTEIRLALHLDPARIMRLQNELEKLKSELPDATEETRGAITAQIDAKAKEIADEKWRVDRDLDNAVDVVRRRLNNSGLAEIPVTRQGRDKILIQLPGMDKTQAEDALSIIQKQGSLEFRLVVSEDDPVYGRMIARLRELDPKGEVFNIHETTMETGTLVTVTPDQIGDDGRSVVDGKMLFDWLKEPDEILADGTSRPRSHALVMKKVELRGDAIAVARAEPDPSRASWRVLLEFDAAGATEFERITGASIGKRLAIVLDGQLQSAPVIQARISGGNAEISGNFDQRSAHQLDVVLKSGSLKVKIEKEYDNSVGATLGEDSIRSGFFAMIIGICAILVFMVVYYRLAGVVTAIVLFVNALLVMAVLAKLNATMTLPGFAGFILTIGMAVDANVLIFERIREERTKGNSLARSINLGYERAFTTIIDSNLTTVITAIILHEFGTEQVRGFALTLIFGIMASMFCSVVLTRWIFDALVDYKLITDLKMSKLFDNINFDFVGTRRIALGISGILMVLSLALFIARGENNFGQDFTGGVLANVVPAKSMTMEQARTVVGSKMPEFPDARDNLQSYGSADKDGKYSEFVVRTKLVELDKDARAEGAKKGIIKHDADTFRASIRKAFDLVPDGYSISGDIKPLGDDRKAITAKLSLLTPHSPAEVLDLLKEQGTVTPLQAGPVGSALADIGSASKDPVTEMEIVVSVPIRDLIGQVRDDTTLAGQVRESLQALRQGKKIDFTDPFPRFTSVGRTVAKAMEYNALMALLASLLAIFIYVWLRFQFRVGFGLGAIVSMAHDAVLLLGGLALVDSLGIMNGQIDLTVTAAFLTVLGYSLNDTIVVFDRIREFIGDSTNPGDAVINSAINQTLSRTLITSVTTLFVVLALLVFGGDVIRGFAFVLLIGILIGTYSSIFIASPIMVEFAHFKARKEKAKIDQATQQSLGK